MIRLVAIIALLSLTSCSAGGALKLIGGGGPKVAANVQAGKTNTQTVGETKIKDQRIENTTAKEIRQTADTNKVRADRVERIVVNETPIWLWIALIVALFLDSPLRWPGQIYASVKGAMRGLGNPA
jgi:hypothetical protein